jgi:hypothetical protein
MLTHGEDVEASALRKRGWSYSAIARHLGRVRIPVIANNDSGSKRTRFRSKPNRCRLAAPVVAVRLSSGPAGGQAT